MLRAWRPVCVESIVINAGVECSYLQSASDLNSFESLVNVCAAKHGQELNIAALSRTTGVAALTAKKWIGLLESCYLLYLLRPFHSNLGKRIVKSAKLYFMDSALAGYLTRQPSA
jgi:predicted AAA+ superfamily ATPase